MLPTHFGKTLPAFLLLLAIGFTAQAQQRMSLDEALRQQLVRIAVQGTGGYQGQCLQVMLENISNQVVSLEIPAGQIFASEDTSVQDLMVTEQAMLALAAGERKQRKLYTMCTQSFNMAPKSGESFRMGPMAADGLLALAQKIALKNYQNSTAQSAVWTLANQESTREIYGSDTSMVRDIAQTVSEATGVPITDFIFTPREHRITSIRTSLEGLLKRSLRQARLELMDAEGEVIRTYFTGRRLEQGFLQFRVGASHTLEEDAELYLRLSEGEDVLLERRVFATDSVTPLWHLHQQVAMNYQVASDLVSSVGVYDANDQLYFMIKDDHRIRKGYNRGIFIAGCHVPADQPYFMKVKANGRTIAEMPLDPNAPAPQIYARQSLVGTFPFRVPETLQNARVAIYTGEGEMRRIVYDIHHLNPGEKHISYQFEHFDGPEAVFYIRLTNAAGETVAEKCISCR